jgi:Tfp pilus assembly protein PilF
MSGRPVRWLAGALALSTFGSAANTERKFEVAGHVMPETQASVTLFGAIAPFTAAMLTDSHGAFRFTRLEPGQYTVAAFAPGYGEKRLTIDVGPSSTNRDGRFELTLRLDEGTDRTTLGGKISVAQLAVPERARKYYLDAQKRLEKHDADGAIARLKKAVDRAPRFAEAWNNLGTIAYQTQKYKDAEQYFRTALAADPAAFEPLVNLGGVLLTLTRFDEAYPYNLHAVLSRPRDALANSQLGMNYFELGKLDLAEKYLLEACRLDPGHFSHPQLLLSEIYLRRHDYARTAAQLEDFLRYHPDWPSAAKVRDAIAKLRNR